MTDVANSVLPSTPNAPNDRYLGLRQMTPSGLSIGTQIQTLGKPGQHIENRVKWYIRLAPLICFWEKGHWIALINSPRVYGCLCLCTSQPVTKLSRRTCSETTGVSSSKATDLQRCPQTKSVNEPLISVNDIVALQEQQRATTSNNKQCPEIPKFPLCTACTMTFYELWSVWSFHDFPLLSFRSRRQKKAHQSVDQPACVALTAKNTWEFELK